MTQQYLETARSQLTTAREELESERKGQALLNRSFSEKQEAKLSYVSEENNEPAVVQRVRG